jgi:hypothetical protein
VLGVLFLKFEGALYRGSGFSYRGRKISNRTGSTCTKKRSPRPAAPSPAPATTCRPGRPTPSGEGRPDPPRVARRLSGRPVFSFFLSRRSGLSKTRRFFFGVQLPLVGICDGDTFSNKSQYGDMQWSPYWIGYVRHNFFRRSIHSKPKL